MSPGAPSLGRASPWEPLNLPVWAKARTQWSLYAAPFLHPVSTSCKNEEKSGQSRPMGWELRQRRRSRTQVRKEVFRSNGWNDSGLLFCYLLLSPYLEALGPLANFSSKQNRFDKEGLNVFVLEEYFLILSSISLCLFNSFLNFSFIYTKELIRIKDFCTWILTWMQACHSPLIHFNISTLIILSVHSPPLAWESPCLSCNGPLIAPGQKWTANRLSKL